MAVTTTSGMTLYKYDPKNLNELEVVSMNGVQYNVSEVQYNVSEGRVASEIKARKIINRRLASMYRNSVGRQKWQYTR